MSRTNGTNGEAAGSPVSSNQNGTNGTRNGSMSAPDKPERKINAKEAISKHRNWFSNFEKSKSPSTSSSAGPESVDSARRTSVNKENKPSYVAAAGGLSASKAATPHTTTTPLSPNHATRSNRSSADSIETYMQVVTPLSSTSFSERIHLHIWISGTNSIIACSTAFQLLFTFRTGGEVLVKLRDLLHQG